MLVLAADHLITEQSAFADAVGRACTLAASGKLVTFGIQPDSPETGYGYIEAEGNNIIQFIEKPDRFVGTVDVENLIIIDTPDAVLVANKFCAQDVKHIYSELKAKGHEAHKFHRTVHCLWGTYTVLRESSGSKIKRIEINPGISLSLQMHRHCSKRWVVVSGQMKVINGEREILVNTNESTFIPAGRKHRLTNPGTEPCVIIEVQSGEYVDEDDIVQFEDSYGRI